MKIKIIVHDFLYLIVYSCYIVIALLSTTFFYKYFISVYLYLVGFLLMLLLVNEAITSKMQMKAFLAIPLILVLSIIVLHSSGARLTLNIMAILLFAFCGRNIDFGIIAKTTIVLDIVVLLGVIGASQIGVIENHEFWSYIRGRMREGLGFLYVLYPPTIMGNILFLYLYVYKEKMPWKKMVVLGGITYWLFLKTDARLTFYLSFFTLFICVIAKVGKGKLLENKLLRIVMCSLYPVCAGLSIYMEEAYNREVWVQGIDILLGGRIRYAHAAVQEYGISLIGRPITWIGSGLDAYGNLSSLKYNYVDNMYIQTLVQFGILGFVIIVFGLMSIQIVLYKRREYYLSMIISILAIHGLIDDLIMTLYFNTFWIVIGQIIRARYKDRQNSLYPRKSKNKRSIRMKTV